MKRQRYLIVYVILNIIGACGTSEGPGSLKRTSNDSITATNTRRPIILAAHTDNGEPYFSYIIRKNDSLVNDIKSQKPLAFQGAKNLIVQLDSSHHLLVNGSGLNIYLNEKMEGDYPIASNTGKKEAGILGSWLEKNDTRTSYSAQKGLVKITRMLNNSCSGSFEASFTLNGSNYEMKGEFLNVKIN